MRALLRVAILYLPFAFSAYALTFPLPTQGNKIGAYKKINANGGETILKLAERYDIGVYEMLRANPRLKNRVLESGIEVIIPSQFTLPSGARQGIVLNLANMRIYYYHPDGQNVSTFPVGVGRQGWSTPLGNSQIVSKTKNPAWHPPASIRREAARKGKTLPLVIPPGPKNPLGRYAMNLGFKGILMHGTNSPRSIGLRSSHGCIRMYGRDIEELFGLVDVGTPIRVIYEPKS